MQKYAEIFNSVKKRCPLVHQITNYVTVNDCANITICAGASPVMSHSIDDVADMANIADALVLNIGTLDEGQIRGMLLAGEAAAKKGIPIILDPAGAGATPYRTRTALMLTEKLPVAVIKGNAGEIGTLAGLRAEVRGVDSTDSLDNPELIARQLAASAKAVVVISGAEDIISDGKSAAAVANGVPLMGKISGTGCMASSLCGAFAAVSENLAEGCIAAMAVLGIAGELAANSVNGPGTFKPALFDALYGLSGNDFIRHAKIRQIS